MDKILPEQLERYLKRKNFITAWRTVLCALVLVAAVGTMKLLVMPAITASGTTYCGKMEHTHNADCRTVQLASQCPGTGEIPEDMIEEGETEGTQEPVHGTECYVTIMNCELEEHVHTKSCYSNRKADLETEEEWEKTLPKDLSGNWAEDVLSVAVSQLGYKESTENFIVTEDNKIKGYTRFGDWYGDDYGHWCAMYVSFCLHYAGVDPELMPQDSNCQNWIQTLSKEEYNLYKKAEDYEPVSGDLIFFNWDSDAASDHVGLVVEIIEETETNKKQVKTIEGNAGDDEVTYRTYDIDDERIMGYGLLPTNPEQAETESNIQSFIDEDEFLMQTGSSYTMMSLLNQDEVANDSSLYANDSYAPQGINLTGNWAADMALLANSLIDYEESGGISKIDQWAGGDGTGAWNVNFVNYCLYYAGVDQDSIPWNESYSVADFQSALEQRGLLKGLGEMGLQVGDITICTTSWSSNALVVGVVTSYNPDTGIYKITFGDKDNSGRVVTDEYYADWYSRVMGVLRLSKKTTISSGGNEIEVNHNCGDDIAEVIVTLEDNHSEAENWSAVIGNAIESESTIILSNHFLSLSFKNSNGETFTPSGVVELVINFDTPIQAEVPEDVSTTNVKWLYHLIRYDNSAANPEYAATTYTDIHQNIKRIKLRTEDAYVYALTSVQTDYSDIESVTVSDLDNFLTQLNNSQKDNMEVVLEADIDASSAQNQVKIETGRNVILDLNGHKVMTANTLFVVDGGNFTLKDSKAAAEYEPVQIGNVTLDADKDYDKVPAGDMVGRQAVFDEETGLLTYYVTETAISNQNTGATNEYMVEHKVSITGAIDGSLGDSPAIRINSGSVNMNSGAIVGCNDSAVYQAGGMFFMYDGYICGNSATGSGGGIHSTGDGTICMKGGVIAANKAAVDGGAVYVDADSLYLYGGIISGNRCIEAGSGGGIFARGTSLISVEDGYITNNRCVSEDYNAGGGGIFTTGQAVLKIKSGYITGNYVGGGGGGIRSSSNTMTMTGGYICSNFAETAEGGGISLNTPCTGTITAGYINNNVTNTYEHWGGGGLFCANGDNDAGTYAAFFIKCACD